LEQGQGRRQLSGRPLEIFERDRDSRPDRHGPRAGESLQHLLRIADRVECSAQAIHGGRVRRKRGWVSVWSNESPGQRHLAGPHVRSQHRSGTPTEGSSTPHAKEVVTPATSTPRPHGRPPHYRSLRLGAQSGARNDRLHSPNTRRRPASLSFPGARPASPVAPPHAGISSNGGARDYCDVSSIGTTRKPPAAHMAGGGCRRSCRRRSFVVARSVVRRWPVRRSQITATWSRTIPRRLS
jgi:hypothetical protein